jgi:HD-GYP domain-containing protein (c-di-GMP phosphodiesterase class II)
MADNLQINRVSEGGGEDSGRMEMFARDTNDKLQAMGRSLMSALYMLLRSVKMYDPDNNVFEKPLAQLQDTMNQVIRKDGKLELMGVKQSFYLNGMLIKVDMNALDNVRYLLDEMRAKDVGGFTMMRSVTLPELKNFIWIFSKEQLGDAEEDGVAGKKLISMQLAKWSKLKDKLENEKDESDAKLDRKKYALTCYGRAIFFIRKYMDSLRLGKPLNTSKSLRIIQDFVDISMDHRTHFLGLTTTRIDSDYLSYHQVNTCLMAIVVGNDLGLTKPQLRDLGYIALFHDAGMGTLPDALLSKRGALTLEERALINRAPLVAVRNILREKAINRGTLLRLVTTFEHKVEFGTAVRDAQGNIQMIIPKANLGLYAKIIAMCATYDALSARRPFRDAYGPEVALMLMWTEMRNKFDPELLKVFMRVMAIQPIKVLTRRQQSLAIGLL